MEQKGSALESDYFLPVSKITVLINTIAKMSKHPSIECELSQVLDDFLLKLGECDSYLENGIFNMNFAEAALLIQSSADLYSKKVDLLWDIIFDYQKRLLLSEEQNGDKNKEIEKVEERKRKYKRKRKINTEEDESAKLVSSFSFGSTDNIDYLNQNFEPGNLTQEWGKFQVNTTNDNPSEHAESKKYIFLPSNSIHNEDQDYIGKYDQFHSMSVIEEIFHLEQQKLLVDDQDCVTKMRIDSYVINDFLLKNSISSCQPVDSYILKLKEHINDFFESHKQPEKDTTSGLLQLCCSNYVDVVKEKARKLSTVDSLFGDHSYCSEAFLTSADPLRDSNGNILQELSCKESYVSLERLPFNVVRQKLRRCSLSDSLFDDDNMSSISGHCPSPSHSVRDPKDSQIVEKVVGNLENRSKSCSQDSAFFEDAGDDDFEEADTGTEEAVSSEGATSVNVESAPVITEKMITRADGSQSIKRPAFLLELMKDIPEPKKKKVQTKRLSAKQLKALATGVTAGDRDFEKFFCQQYRPAEGEGIICPVMSESEDSDEEECDRHYNSDEEEERDPEREREEISPENSDDEMSEPEDNNKDDDTHVDPSGPTLLEPMLSPILAEKEPRCSTSNVDLMGLTSTPRRSTDSANTPFSLLSADLEHEEACRKNVRDWRAFILPKIKSLDNRADFDIHEYGSRIIGPSQIGEERHFKDIVPGRNAGEVARYFIATLQLANTYNVEISGAVKNQLSNDSFKIKTIDKTKHHELLEEYQAPSEETFRERLERAKASNSKMHLHSTLDHEAGPSNKKRKTGRRLF